MHKQICLFYPNIHTTHICRYDSHRIQKYWRESQGARNGGWSGTHSQHISQNKQIKFMIYIYILCEKFQLISLVCSAGVCWRMLRMVGQTQWNHSSHNGGARLSYYVSSTKMYKMVKRLAVLIYALHSMAPNGPISFSNAHWPTTTIVFRHCFAFQYFFRLLRSARCRHQLRLVNLTRTIKRANKLLNKISRCIICIIHCRWIGEPSERV